MVNGTIDLEARAQERYVVKIRGVEVPWEVLSIISATTLAEKCELFLRGDGSNPITDVELPLKVKDDILVHPEVTVAYQLSARNAADLLVQMYCALLGPP